VSVPERSRLDAVAASPDGSAAFDSLTADEIHLIRDSYERISVSLRFARNFYAMLFDIAPDLRPLFPDDLTAQARKLTEMLGVLAGTLDRPLEFAMVLDSLGHRHRGYAVRSTHFAPVGRALFATLERELGPRFDDATRRAWIALYALASALMQHPGFDGASGE
jgi:hemoglobin-like flavoprotein